MNDISGYIYIGQYFHRHGKTLDSLTEKKIGKSVDVPARENSLNSTKFTIGYTMIKYWKVSDMDKTEKQLHAILPNRLTGEWFEDEDNSLIDRVSKFMSVSGAIEQSVNTSEMDCVEKNVVKTANKDRSRVSELAGQKFSCSTKEGKEVTIEITNLGKYKCVQNQKEFDNPNAAYTSLIGGSGISGYTRPKNLHGRSIDDELELLPSLNKEPV
jgi:hypothetical protein